MSDCQRAGPRLVAFLVGEVSGRESAWLAEHVRKCAPCQEELASLNLTVEALRRLPREDVSPEFDRKLALRIAEHAPERAASLRRRRRLPWTGLAAGVALALLVLIPFAPHAPRPQPGRGSATGTPPARRAARVQPPPAAPAAAEAPAPRRDTAAARPSPPAPVVVRRAAAPPAPPIIGRVLRVSGIPRVAPGEGRQAAPVRAGMALRAGAVLTTGDAGQAEVEFATGDAGQGEGEFAGGARVRLDFDTSVTFAAAPAAGRKVQDVVHLSSGRLYLLVPRSQRGLTVHTPQARVEALGPMSAISVVSADRPERSGPGLHLELAGLTTATAMRGRVRLASRYGSVIAEQGASAQAAAAGAPSLAPGMAHLASVRAQAPWGQTFFEVWVADRLELNEALKWVMPGDDALLAANQLLADGWVGQARQEYARLAEANPDDAAPFCNLGLAAELDGDAEAGLAAYRRAVALAPDSACCQHNLGMAYLRIGNLWRACAHLAAALEVEPDLPGTRFEFGRALSVLGEFEEAAHQAQLLQVSPETAAQGACLLGDICWLQSDMAGAEDWYLRAVQADPTHVNAMSYLGGINLLAGRLDEARAWVDRALAVDADSLRALNRLGLILTAEHRFHEAEAALLQAEAAHPGSGIVLHNLGEAYLRDGDLPAAIEACRQAVAAAPDSVLCHMGLAIALETSGEAGEARREYRTTLDLDPAYAEAADRLAALLERLGEPSAAEVVLAGAAEYLP